MMMMKPAVAAYNHSNNRSLKPLLHPPSYIVYNDIRFLIIDTPSISNMSRYIKEFEHWNVTDVVRCCKATYSQSILIERGIQVHDWIFSDGDPPSKDIIDEWLDLIDSRFKKDVVEEEKDRLMEEEEEKNLEDEGTNTDDSSCDDDDVLGNDSNNNNKRRKKKHKRRGPCIAAHCVAGLGRAPVLVAIALIEEGMDPLDSIEYIRKHRQGAINNRQLKYLESYKRRRRRRSSSSQGSCIIS